MNDDENAEVEEIFEKERWAKATREEVDSSEMLQKAMPTRIRLSLKMRNKNRARACSPALNKVP